MGRTKENRGKYILMKILPKPSPSQRDMPVEVVPAEDIPARDIPAEDIPVRDTPARGLPAEDSPAENSHTEDLQPEDMPAESVDTPAETMPADDSSTAALTPSFAHRARDPRGGGLGRSSIGSARGRRGRLQGCVLPVRLPRDFTIGHFLVGVGIAAAGVGVIFLDAGQDCTQAQAQAQAQMNNSKQEGDDEARGVPLGVPLIVITPPAETKRTFEWWFGPADIALRMSARE